MDYYAQSHKQRGTSAASVRPTACRSHQDRSPWYLCMVASTTDDQFNDLFVRPTLAGQGGRKWCTH